MRMIAPMTGEPKIGGDRGERRARGEHGHDLVGDVFPGQPDGQDRQAAAEGDERGLGSQHETQAQGGQRGEQDAGQLGWLGGPGLDPLVGDVAAATGQPHDRDGRQHPGDGEYGQRPPPGDGMQVPARWAGSCTPLAGSSGPVPGSTTRRTRPAPRSARRRRAGRGSSCSGSSRPDRAEWQSPHSPGCLLPRPRASRRRPVSAPGLWARVTSGTAASRNGRAGAGCRLRSRWWLQPCRPSRRPGARRSRVRSGRRRFRRSRRSPGRTWRSRRGRRPGRRGHRSGRAPGPGSTRTGRA